MVYPDTTSLKSSHFEGIVLILVPKHFIISANVRYIIYLVFKKLCVEVKISSLIYQESDFWVAFLLANLFWI